MRTSRRVKVLRSILPLAVAACTLALSCGGGGGNERVIPPSGVDLRLTMAVGPGALTPGGTVTFTLSYANVGALAASGVTITDTVPDNSTFNPGASTPGWTCAPNNAAGSDCEFDIGALAVGAGNSVTFVVTVANPLPGGVNGIFNSATIADDGTQGPEQTPNDNTATGSKTIFLPTFTPAAAAPGANTLSMQPGGTNLTEFDVEVRVTGIDDFYGAAFRVTFDPAVVDYLGFSQVSSFISQIGVFTEFRVDEVAAGQLAIVATRRGLIAGVDAPAPTASALLLTLNFEALVPTAGSPIAFGPSGTREVRVCPTAVAQCPAVADATLTWAGGTLTAN